MAWLREDRTVRTDRRRVWLQFLSNFFIYIEIAITYFNSWRLIIDVELPGTVIFSPRVKRVPLMFIWRYTTAQTGEILQDNNGNLWGLTLRTPSCRAFSALYPPTPHPCRPPPSITTGWLYFCLPLRWLTGAGFLTWLLRSAPAPHLRTSAFRSLAVVWDARRRIHPIQCQKNQSKCTKNVNDKLKMQKRLEWNKE